MLQKAEVIRETIHNIGNDMLEPVGYLLSGIIVGSLFLYFFEIAYYFFMKKSEKWEICYKKRWILFLSIIYVTVLLKLVYFSREPGSRSGIDINLLDIWGNSIIEHAYVIENILMFIPFGILFPSTFFSFRRCIRCIAIGCLCSISIEIMQLISKRGFCQLDDIVLNTIGTAIGYIMYKLFFILFRKIFFRKLS